MSSIRTKATLFTVLEIVAVVATVATLAVFSLISLGNDSSARLLELLSETGARNINAYFGSVSQSVESVADYATFDLAHTELADLGGHLERVSDLFEKVASNTSGVRTYYYRIDPAVSKEPGFWFVQTGRDGFVEHTPTDITTYDTADQSALVWFTVPKATGSPIWLAPYVTDNLDVYVLSYNVPIYKGRTFVGVIGIEIDYTTVANAVNSIKFMEKGHAFITDAEGGLVYHPLIDVARLPKEELPKTPDGLLSDESSHVRYTYGDERREAVWSRLDNGMRLYVSVPVSEIDSAWRTLVVRIVVAALGLLLVAVLITRHFMGRITGPLLDLTKAAEQLDAGNYDVELSYDGGDEVGTLTRTVKRLVDHLKVHLEELNSLAYADPLTHVHNKGAYAAYAKDLEAQIADPERLPAFAIAMFDCDYLKRINDQYGHDKGDIYLTCACSLICHVFDHSPVFRIGGDEFCAVLTGEDFRNREMLAAEFDKRCAEQYAREELPWKQVSVSYGIAAYDPGQDRSVDDVSRRADKLMYDQKWRRNAAR